MIYVNLVYKNESFPIRLEAEDRLSVVFDFIREVTPLSVETCTMIYKGKKLPLFAAAKDVVADGAKILLIGSTRAEVDYVKQARADPLVKGFDALERDEKLRRKRIKMLQKTFWGTPQDKEYKFCSVKAEFKYTTPTPYDAEALLQKLVTDPGIVKIMTERKFVVGILTEMSPAEAQERMAREGKSGDLLGFNENYGARIVLRIRTDDVKGFRPYYDLINTLIHELTHNVFGPHDDKFWALFRDLKADYDRFHDGWSRNGKTKGSDGMFNGFDNDSDDDDDAVITAPLGGEFVADRATVRELAAQRAMARLAASRDADANPAKVLKSSSTHKTASTAVPSSSSCCAHNDKREKAVHNPDTTVLPTPDHENLKYGDARIIDNPPVHDGRPVSTCASNRIPDFIVVDKNGDERSASSYESDVISDFHIVDETGQNERLESPYASDLISDVIIVDENSEMRPDSPYVSNVVPDGSAVDDNGDTRAASPCDTTPLTEPAPEIFSPHAVEGPTEATPEPHVGSRTAIGVGGNQASAGAIGGNADIFVDGFGTVLDGIESSGLEWFHAFQAAVRELPRDVLSTLLTLTRNLKLHPDDPKFRTVKATAPRVQILASNGGDKCMKLLGFERKSDQYTMDSGRIDLGKFIMACEMLEP